jgi:hypothetical protein
MEDARMTAVNFTDTLVIRYLSDRPPVFGGARRGGRYEVLYSYEPEATMSLWCWLVIAAAWAYDDAITVSVTRVTKGIGMTIDVRDFAPARQPYNPATAITNPCSTPAGALWSDVVLSQLCEITRAKPSYDDFLGITNGIGMTIDMQDSACHRICDLSLAVTNECFTPPQALGFADAAWLLSCDFARREVSCDDFFGASGISDTNGIDTRIDMLDLAFAFNQLDDQPLAEANPFVTPPRAFGPAAAWLLPCDIARKELSYDFLEDTRMTATTGAGTMIDIRDSVPVGRHRYDPPPASTDPYFRTPRTSGFDDTSWCMSPWDIARKRKSDWNDYLLEDIGMIATTAGTMIDMRGFVPSSCDPAGAR